jgi:molybdenum cofactor biosynthesis protein B
MSAPGHHGKTARRAGCAVLTISDTRTAETDASGRKIQELLVDAGHRCVAYAIVPDEPERIREHLRGFFADGSVDVVLLTGGTGLAPRDTTFEAVRGLLDKEIDGFGELFRMLSFQEIGPAAMLSRAVAGIATGKVLFSMPGSTAAVELAMRRLILPELGHVLHLVQGEPPR